MGCVFSYALVQESGSGEGVAISLQTPIPTHSLFFSQAALPLRLAHLCKRMQTPPDRNSAVLAHGMAWQFVSHGLESREPVLQLSLWWECHRADQPFHDSTVSSSVRSLGYPGQCDTTNQFNQVISFLGCDVSSWFEDAARTKFFFRCRSLHRGLRCGTGEDNNWDQSSTCFGAKACTEDRDVEQGGETTIGTKTRKIFKCSTFPMECDNAQAVRSIVHNFTPRWCTKSTCQLVLSVLIIWRADRLWSGRNSLSTRCPVPGGSVAAGNKLWRPVSRADVTKNCAVWKD